MVQNKQKKIILIVGVIALIAVIIGLVLNNRNSTSKENSDKYMENDQNSNEAGDDVGKEDKNDKTEENIKDNASQNTGVTTQGIIFPYKIPNTSLVIQKLDSYEGTFLEDGSDSEVSNVTTIVLKNTGNVPVEYTEIKIDCGKSSVYFNASAIPAGGMVVVQEKNKTPYSGGTYINCQAEVALVDKLEMSEDKVKIVANKDNSFTITNLTDEDIPCVRVFYKFYMSDEKAYIGGITYTSKIVDLKANSSQKITPNHYISEYSKIVMVRTYDTAE